MKEVNFNNKVFKLLKNSTVGEVDSQTIFKYHQEGDLVTADYSGGAIIYGKIIAQHCGETLQMLYNCYTSDRKLKAGKAMAKISSSKNGKIKLTLNWQWLNDDNQGTSSYIEI